MRVNSKFCGLRAVVAAGSAVWLGALTVVAATPTPPYTTWEFRAPVVVSPATPKGYVKMDLSNETFTHLQPDLSDLRIASNGSLAVPYAVAIERETASFANVPARMTNLSSQSDVSTSFILDVGSAGVLHNQLTIQTPSENFRRMVTVEGSDDQMSWRTLNPQGQIFDYTVRDIKPVAVRDTRVGYPDATFRYLRVTIRDAGEPPLAVTGAGVTRSIASGAREVSYNPGLTAREDGERKVTDITLDLGMRGIPHRRGRIVTGSENFHRSVAIYDSDNPEDDASWRLLTSAYLFSVATEKFTGSNLDFSYPESNRRYLRLVVSNGDDAPIRIDAAVLYGVVRSIIFPFDPSQTYYLYAGNPAAARTQYDLTETLRYVESADLDRVRLGAVEKNPDYAAPQLPQPPLTERSPYMLPVMLGLVVAVLAFLLFRVVGHAVSFPPHDPQP